MTEGESNIQPDYLAARIDALEQLLRVTVATLTPEQREFISDAAWEYQRKLEEMSHARQTDPLRDKAAIAFDLAESLDNAFEDWGSDFDEKFRRG